MADPLDMPATQLEIMADRILIASIGKALVKKGLITHSDIASELSGTIQALDGKKGSELLAAELKNILGSVLTW